MAIDRLAPTARPAGRAVGYQRWRNVLFLHWPVPEAILRPHVPEQLTLDLFEGMAYIGVVAFRMEGVRTAWTPAPLALRFPETNVRTYVHADGKMPGVYFFSLDAASLLAVAVARAQWGLPYYYARMRVTASDDYVEYGMVRRGSRHVTMAAAATIGATLEPAGANSQHFFLLERYVMYLERRATLWAARVHHTPYPAREASLLRLNESLVAAAGIRRPDTNPLVLYSPGVDVEVFGAFRCSR